MADYAIGNRVAELRRRRGMTQEGLAEAAGLAVGVVRKVEQGGTARMESYHVIARALGVVTMVFVPPASAAPEPIEAHDGRDLILADMRDAIVPPVGLDGPIYQEHLDEGAPDLDRLQQATRSLVAAYHGNRYDFVAQMAPGLIRSAHYHVDTVGAQRRRDAVRLRGDVLGLTGRYLIQVRAHDLALIAFRDALRDATEAGDQPLAASVIGSQAWVMLRQARFTEVERLCAAVADELEPRMSTATPDTLGAWGRMLLRASSAAARNNRPDEAREYLSMATAAAARVGREDPDIPGHMSFGPLTVAVKGVEGELIAGKPDTALRLAEQLPRDVGEITPSGWQRHRLDVARALAMTGEHDRATEVLEELRQQAPDWLRHQRLARDIAGDLVRARKRMPTEEQRSLADFLGADV